MTTKYGVPAYVDGKRSAEYMRAWRADPKNAPLIASARRRVRTKGGYTRTESEYRAMAVSLLLERDGSLCSICGQEMPKAEIQIDHEKPRVLGGSYEASNIRLAHRACNRAKGSKYATVPLVARLCSVDGCRRIHRSQGLCSTHEIEVD